MLLPPLACLLLLAAPAAGESAPAARRALEGSKASGSVRSLLPSAYRMARQWSSGAALYSILGRSPRNRERYEPEEWAFIFGDSAARDGAFEVVFHDGVLYKRQGIRESLRLVEFFKAGRLVNRRSEMVEWEGFDYERCRPVDPGFIDSVDLMEKVRREKVLPAEFSQFRVALLAPRNDDCDGLGPLSRFISEKPIPKGLRRKTLWIVSGAVETLFISGRSGTLLHRRERGPRAD